MTECHRLKKWIQYQITQLRSLDSSHTLLKFIEDESSATEEEFLARFDYEGATREEVWVEFLAAVEDAIDELRNGPVDLKEEPQTETATA